MVIVPLKSIQVLPAHEHFQKKIFGSTEAHEHPRISLYVVIVPLKLIQVLPAHEHLKNKIFEATEAHEHPRI